MAHNFVFKEPTLMIIVSGNLLPSDRQLFPALKRNLG
jgi:hypothetical protein